MGVNEENNNNNPVEQVEELELIDVVNIEDSNQLDESEVSQLDEIQNQNKIEFPESNETQITEGIYETPTQDDLDDVSPMADCIEEKKSYTKVKKIAIRIGVSVVTVLLFVFITLLGGVMIINYGPSNTARNLFVNSVMESSAGKFLATTFFTKEQINDIKSQNSVIAVSEVTNSDLITINQPDQVQADVNPLEIIEVSASTYKGKMVVVHDPSRVTVGVSGNYGPSYSGKTVKDMAISYNAIAAINGGGFLDESGMGNGGTPIGIVISEGKLKYGSLSSTYEIIGFDNQNKLVVGNMTGQQALDRGVRDAISFGPILVVNGQPSIVNGSGSGVNPRTAIGQRADGAMLLLVIDGRQTNSLGATYADLVEIMLKFGAVNAANLDGGSSTLLYYNGNYINNCASLYGPRNMPTSIIVK